MSSEHDGRVRPNDRARRKLTSPRSSSSRLSPDPLIITGSSCGKISIQSGGPLMAYSIANDDAALLGSTHAAERLHRWPGTTRRGVQTALGVLWLLDAALQLQP